MTATAIAEKKVRKSAVERKDVELSKLLNEHRLIKVDIQQEHVTCTARVDMPEYGIKRGEMFHLVACGSYPGYAYIVTWDAAWNKHACSCKSYQFRHACQDADLVNEVCKAKYHQRKSVPARQFEDWGESDTAAHVEDSIASGELDAIDAERAAWAKMTPEQRRVAYSEQFDLSYGDVA